MKRPLFPSSTPSTLSSDLPLLLLLLTLFVLPIYLSFPTLYSSFLSFLNSLSKGLFLVISITIVVLLCLGIVLAVERVGRWWEMRGLKGEGEGGETLYEGYLRRDGSNSNIGATQGNPRNNTPSNLRRNVPPAPTATKPKPAPSIAKRRNSEDEGELVEMVEMGHATQEEAVVGGTIPAVRKRKVPPPPLPPR